MNCTWTKSKSKKHWKSLKTHLFPLCFLVPLFFSELFMKCSILFLLKLFLQKPSPGTGPLNLILGRCHSINQYQNYFYPVAYKLAIKTWIRWIMAVITGITTRFRPSLLFKNEMNSLSHTSLWFITWSISCLFIDPINLYFFPCKILCRQEER